VKPLFPALLLGVFALVGCVDQYGRVRPPDPIGAIFDTLDPSVPTYQSRQYVVTRPIPTAPPSGYYQRRTVAPASYTNPYWVDGYWGWRDTDWAWAPGRWVNRPRANAIWYNGRYYTANNRQYWRSGYWR